MPIEALPIFCYYDQQRFRQFGAMDCANWYGIAVESAKKKQALYPAMGRQHIRTFNTNRLIFDNEPRALFKTVKYMYVIVGTRVFQYDQFYNQKLIGNIALTGTPWFAFLPVGTDVYAMLTDETNIYLITESGTAVTMVTVTDGRRPTAPQYVAAFGNRFVVSQKDTPDYYLSTVNVAGGASGCFSFGSPPAPLTNRASGIIRQFGVLHTQLYIFTDFTTDVWANIATQISVGAVITEFPWKLNTSYNFDYGMADPFSLSIGFGRMVWLAKNQDGLVSFMASNGQQPEDISSQAINVLLENADDGSLSTFLLGNAYGFIYQYENTVFYRVSSGVYSDSQILDINTTKNSIEYNFETGTWHRLIELNGERNRIQKHVYFNNRHIVSVQSDNALYEMAGNIYVNELRTPSTLPQATNAFTPYPMRYELITKQLFLEDYAEFIDDYVQIDFVFGDKAFYKSDAPFDNTTFVIDEDSIGGMPVYMVSEDGKFIITEDGNYPTIYSEHWNALFKPHVELYISDDGGVTFLSADVREPWQLGEYRWIMRWNELGTSRNRCYKLICVSPAPIVILGAVRNTRRASGGAN
jgi:hypothetical protein